MSQKSLAQYRQHTRRRDLTDTLQRLEMELRIEVPRTPRRHLDVLIRLADVLLEDIVATSDEFKTKARLQLSDLRRRVLLRSIQFQEMAN